MKRLLTLSILLGTLFPGVYSEETGWNYKQTTGQAFYMFGENDLTIDGEVLESSDVIGAFTSDGVCVGWTYATANNGVYTVLAVGNDGEDYAANYLNTGDIPSFRVWDSSSGDDSTPTTQNAVLPIDMGDITYMNGAEATDGGYENLAIYILMGSAPAANVSGCSDGESCTFGGDHWLSVTTFNDDTAYQETGGSITTDDGSCAYNDCNGDCGGTAVVDDCGVCGGGNADDLGCGCFYC